MHTVTLEVASREVADRRFLHAFDGQPQGDVISFETPALLFKVLTQKRWELLSAMTGAGPMTLREAARRVGRGIKAVLGDVHALLDAGILQKTEGGQIVFPFDAIRVDFVLQGESVRQHRAGRILEFAGSGLWEGGLPEMRGDIEQR